MLSLRKLLMANCVLLFHVVTSCGTAQAAVPSAFCFGPNHSWVIVYEDGSSWGYRFVRAPAGLADAIKEMAKTQTILGVGMNEHGWILVGAKTWSGKNLPSDLTDYLRTQVDQGHQIIDAALTSTGSWVVISRRNGYYRWRFRFQTQLEKTLSLAQNS